MTAAQFVEKFRLLTEVVSSYEAPGLLDAEICDLLNIAQKEVTLELCVAGKFDTLYSLNVQEGLSMSPELFGPFGDTGRVYKGTFTNNLFYPISGQIAVSRTGLDSSGFIPSYQSSNTIMRMEEVRVEDALKFITSPLNKNTIFLYPKYWIEGGGTNSNGVLKVVIDTYSTLGTFTSMESQPNVVFTYIKTPTEISVSGGTTSNLPDSLHEVILKKAVEERNKSLINNSNKN